MAHLATAVCLLLLVLVAFLESTPSKAAVIQRRLALAVSFLLGSILAQVIAAFFQSFAESNPADELLKTVTRKLEDVPGEQSSLEQRREELEEELRSSNLSYEERKAAILSDTTKTSEESDDLRDRVERTCEAMDAADAELAEEEGKLLDEIELVRLHMNTLAMEVETAKSMQLSRTKAFAIEMDNRSLELHRDLNKELTRRNLSLKKQLEKQESLGTETSSLLQEKERLEGMLRPRRVK